MCLSVLKYTRKGYINMKHLFKSMTALLLSLMLLMAFMPNVAFADDAGSEEDYALSFNDGYRGDSVLYYYITASAPGEFNQGDKLTVNDHGRDVNSHISSSISTMKTGRLFLNTAWASITPGLRIIISWI